MHGNKQDFVIGSELDRHSAHSGGGVNTKLVFCNQKLYYVLLLADMMRLRAVLLNSTTVFKSESHVNRNNVGAVLGRLVRFYDKCVEPMVRSAVHHIHQVATWSVINKYARNRRIRLTFRALICVIFNLNDVSSYLFQLHGHFLITIEPRCHYHQLKKNLSRKFVLLERARPLSRNVLCRSTYLLLAKGKHVLASIPRFSHSHLRFFRKACEVVYFLSGMTAK